MDIVRLVGLSFFSREQIAKPYQVEMNYRKALLAQRASVKQQLNKDDEALTKQINALTKRLKQTKQRERELSNQHLDEDIRQAKFHKNTSRVHHLCRLRARKGLGIRKRDYRSHASFTPTTADVIEFISAPGDQGGFSATTVPTPPFTQQRDLTTTSAEQLANDYPPQRPPTGFLADSHTEAKLDIKHVRRGLLCGMRRRYSPPWSIPTEVLCFIVAPAWVSAPAAAKTSLEESCRVDPLDFDKKPAVETKWALKEGWAYRAPLCRLERLLAHARHSQRLPAQARASKVFLSDKKKVSSVYAASVLSTPFVVYGKRCCASFSSERPPRQICPTTRSVD